MCYWSTGKQVSQVNNLCDGGCTCPAGLPIDDEIKRLELPIKILQDQIEIISKEITGLETVNES